MKFIIYGKIEFELDAETKELAQEEATKTFTELETKGVKISEARFADKKSGYFV